MQRVKLINEIHFLQIKIYSFADFKLVKTIIIRFLLM